MYEVVGNQPEMVEGNMNLYAFVSNDPANTFDVLGLAKWFEKKIVAKSFINGLPRVGSFGKAGVADGSNWRLQNFAATIGKLPAFNQNPQTDKKNGIYRLYATMKVKFCCEGDKLVSYKIIDEDMDGGKELPGVKGTIEALQGHKRISDSTIEVLLESWGRPDTKAELGMQAVKPRKSYFIWNRATIRMSCGGGPHNVMTFTGSKFPSRKLWINEKMQRHIEQGALSDLWTDHPTFPNRVAP